MGKLVVVVRCSKKVTNLLHSIVAEANKEEEYEILRPDGRKVIVKSFAEAWKEVKHKISDGENIGYLSIKN